MLLDYFETYLPGLYPICNLTLAEADERFIVARFARSYIISSQLSLRR